MGIGNIHVWADGEVITHTDLNSIGLGISQELESGAVGGSGSGGVAWPLVAQGDLNMNGFDIIDFLSAAGIVHINGENNMAEALNAAVPGSVFVIDPSGVVAITANNIAKTGIGDITIIGYGKTTPVVIGAAVTTAGISFDSTCDRITFLNVHFTGGTAGKPALLFNSPGVKLKGCTFETPIGVTLGTTDACSNAQISECDFGNCSIGVNAYGLLDSGIYHNTFTNCGSAIRLPGNGENGFKGCLVLDNKIVGGAGNTGIAGVYVGATSEDYAYNVISGNTMTGSTELFLNLLGYTGNVVTWNLSNDGGVSISGYNCVISGNAASYMAESGGSNNTLRDNAVSGDTVITSSYSSVVGNTFGSVTVTSYPEYYGMNRGF